jgi:uncharacterized protein YqeY
MSLREQLRNDLAEAMRSGETLRRDTLRMTLSALALVEKEAKHDASDDETLGVIVKAVKTRRESVEAYTAAARPDLAAAERERHRYIGSRGNCCDRSHIGERDGEGDGLARTEDQGSR